MFWAAAAAAAFALLGLYATYLDKGLSVDAAFKADLLTMKYAAASGLSFKPSVTSLGGELDIGQRLDGGGGIFVEPLGSFAFARTDIDSVPLATGTVLSFPGNTSARLSEGLRAGTGFSETGYNAEVSLTGRVWEEFAGSNAVGLGPSGATPITFITDRPDRVFGDIMAGANVFEAEGGLSGFLNAGVKFGSHFTSETVSGGLRYHW
jgi:outer membrane autotransporter protein